MPHDAGAAQTHVIIYSQCKHKYRAQELMSWGVIRISMAYIYGLER